MPYKLQGRNVLIVGGARGLGVSIAEKFAAEGCNIAINYLSSQQQADDLALRLEKEFNIKTTTVQGDAGVQADCVRLVRTAIERFSGLDIIISNAVRTAPSYLYVVLNKKLTAQGMDTILQFWRPVCSR
jgi:NAD(P)-dependent dehydrogenase (short-subunit alcohol dehydrogenase family)